MLSYHVSNLLKPFVEPVLFVAAALFVFVVRRKATFGNLVHAPGSNLQFYPAALRTHYRGVQRLVAIAFGAAQPVAQALCAGLVLAGNDAVHLPAIGFFLLSGAVQNYADGKQIIHFVKRHTLLFYFVPNAVDAFGSAINFKVQLCQFQLFFQRPNKFVDVAAAFALGFAEPLRNVFVRLGLHVLHGQIFHFGFYGVQPHAVGQWRIHPHRFAAYLQLLFALHAVQRAHVV